MRNIVKIFLLIMTLTLASSCGKKGALQYPGNQERPNFNGYSDEIEMPNKKVQIEDKSDVKKR